MRQVLENGYRRWRRMHLPVRSRIILSRVDQASEVDTHARFTSRACPIVFSRGSPIDVVSTWRALPRNYQAESECQYTS